MADTLDSKTIIDAAAALGISEYDLLALAYRRWRGADLDPTALEAVFDAYMFRHQVPAWARHLAREILAERDAGTLDPTAFEVQPFLKRQPPPRHRRLVLGMVTLAFLAFYALLFEVSYDPGTSAPMACRGAIGNWLVEHWAEVVSGRRLPPCEDVLMVTRPTGE